MIIRVVNEGQWDVPNDQVWQLQGIDTAITSALAARDGSRLRSIMDDATRLIRSLGTPIEEGVFRVSDVVLPSANTPIPEIVTWLRDATSDVQGVIPDDHEAYLSDT